jgi:multidrug resistance efflux pump
MKRLHVMAGFGCMIAGITVFAQAPVEPRAKPPARKFGGDEEAIAALEERIKNTIRAGGTLISLDPGDVKCQVPEGGRIVELIEEGAGVRKGDVLVRLDDTAVKDNLRSHEAAVAAAGAALAQAKAVLSLREQDLTDGRENGALAIKAAELAREKYLGDDGEHQVHLKAVESEKEIAQERLKTAETILKAVMEAGASGAAAERQVAEARLAAFEAKAALQVAEGKRQLLTTRTLAYQTAVLDLAVAEAKAARARAIRQAEAALAQAVGDVRTREEALLAERNRLERTKQALDRCVIRAPRDGFVVHASPRGRAATLLEVGSVVQSGQLLVQIPDMSRLGVRVLVNETRIGRVEVGDEVSVRLEVLSTKIVRGKISSVANQPEQPSWLSGDMLREYAAIVTLDEATGGVKLGMTALAEIHVSGTAAKPAPAKRQR